MRRAFVSILLASLSFPLIAPLLIADTESNLPPCCRRNGKHHCAMMATVEGASSGRAFRAIQPKCPCFPAANTVPANPNAALLRSLPEFSALLFSRPAGQARTAAGYRISFNRSRQKRGPPAPLS
jgi:hypothetical protein